MRMNVFFRTVLFLLFLGLLAACSSAAGEEKTSEHMNRETDESVAEPAEYAIVIHGGAGTILKKNMTPERESEIRKALNDALTIGEDILRQGGSSLDAVTQTIIFLENDPNFNAGRGAVFTHEGINELDASIMEGATLQAGAVGGVTTIKNPITLARAVMEHSEHVMLTGEGAEQFAREQGLELVDPAYFRTEARWNSLQRAREAESKRSGMHPPGFPDYKLGTVGCVALDKSGRIVAGTSTGGMTNKKYNRIGDSPIIGAGTYANDETCGVSCTGHGEFFIRYAVAYDMSALMNYQSMSVEEAGNHIIQEKLKAAGGTGGLIALDRQGNVAMPFNTAGMYRGYAKPGERVVKIYKD